MNNYRKHFRSTFKLAYPVTIGQLGHVMLGVMDSMMVGRVGAESLAAASLVNGLVFLVVVFGLGITLAITPLVAIAKGKNDSEQCGIILRQGFLINVIVSVLLSIFIFVAADLIFFLNQPPRVASLAASYTQILSLSILPFMLFQNYRQFIEGLHYTKPAMYITLLANIINVFGNWVLIYGKLGMPALGLDGAGYSTVLTRIFMAASMMLFVMNSRRFSEYDPSLKFRSINWFIIRKILNIGIPTGFQHVFEVGAFAFSAVMIGWLGSKPLAAHQIALNLASITFMFILGISAAGTIRVGNAVGRQDPQRIREVGFSAIFLAAGIMAIFGIIFIVLRKYLPLLYIHDSEVISLAAQLIVVAAFFQISDGVQASGLGVLRGLTDVKVPMIISFFAYWIVGFPLGYLLGFIYKRGAVGIWIGLLTGLTVAAALFTLRFHLKTRILREPPAK
ncbi:MAG: MATE family efflux transporter [bacterium]|nr:MAG: MATE family efflux transporter [bacterium]